MKWKEIERRETNELVFGTAELGFYFSLVYVVTEQNGDEIRERRAHGKMLYSVTAWEQLGASFAEAALAFQVAAPAIEALRGACRGLDGKKRKR